MQAEILMIGTELLLGQINDTNATHIARVLAGNGINLYQKTTVGDNRARIVGAMRNALGRSDVVLCSGGLGPTEDDLTRECLAEVFDRPLEYHEEIFARIEAMFARYRIRLTENNRKQALVPEGAIVLENPHGTAPGLLIDDAQGIIVCMPGVPRELEAMLAEKVFPYLRERFELSEVIFYRVLKVCGLGESRVDDAMGDLMAAYSNPTIGVLANPRFVRIRIAARAPSREAAEALIAPVEAELRERLPGLVMGIDEETLEGVVDGLLADRGWTMAVIETVTGGMIGQRLVTEGASRFAGARVYTDRDLDPAALVEDGRRYAEALRAETGADCVLALMAHPEAERTYALFLHPGGFEQWEAARAGTGEIMQVRASTVALEFLRRFLTAGRIDLRPAASQKSAG